MILKKSMKYALKSQAHALKPTVLMGSKGLTPAVIQEIDFALAANELIKVKLTGVEREDKHEVLDTICQQLHAHLIQVIGRVATLYREKPEEPSFKIQVKPKHNGSTARRRQ
jgi:RNA-binding protein